jgi:iron complex outermembrane receptor protein
MTVTAFGAAQIEESHIVGVQDIITRTPGLSFDAFPASDPRLFIR